MKLYDSLIEEISLLIKSADECRVYKYNEQKIWPESKDYELILQRDMAYELGGHGSSSVNYTLVTTGSDYVDRDETVIYGKDLQDINSDTSYARIAIVRVKQNIQANDKENENWDMDSEKVYQILSDIDFVKYHIFPKGYMFRNSGETGREQVRIGRKELSKGMTFEYIGNTMISHYKKNPNVLAVRLIFVTGNIADYEKMTAASGRATNIRRSLSMINRNLPTECSICGIRDICNEVEGLRELHFGKKTGKPEDNKSDKKGQKIILQ